MSLLTRVVAASLLWISMTVLSASADETHIQIIDGTRVPATDYPAVALVSVGEFGCTGTLVGTRHVLTAAHCFYNERNRRVTDLGSMRVILNNVPLAVRAVTVHPTYVSRSAACIEGEVDAAIVELQSVAAGIAPIPLWRSVPTAGTALLLAGFGTQGTGRRGEDGTFPPDGFLNIGATVVESITGGYVNWVFNPGESNTAGGDSGGPAFVDDGGVRYVHSITCGGTGNAGFDTESNNTRVDLIAGWVDSIVGATPANVAPTILSPGSITIGQNLPFSYTVQTTGTAPIALTAAGLPDGVTLSGTVLSGVPTAAGSYTVTLTAANVAGSAAGSLLIKVTTFDPSTALTLTKATVDFSENVTDLLALQGTLVLGSAFTPKGSKVTVQVAGLVESFTLNRQGFTQRRGGFDIVRLKGKMKRGFYTVPSVRFYIGLGDKDSLFDSLDKLFPFYEDRSPSPSERVYLPVQITINGVSYESTIPMAPRRGGSRWVSVAE